VVGELIETGRATHAYLGLQPAPVAPDVAQWFDLPVDHGALVLAVEPGTPATKGGLQPGDVITGVAQRDVRTLEDLLAENARHQPGDAVEVHIARGDQEQDLSVRLTDRPST
jgi:S1-C subfamily serine protease